MEFVETEKIELKRKYTDAIEKEIVAFLNTEGHLHKKTRLTQNTVPAVKNTNKSRCYYILVGRKS